MHLHQLDPFHVVSKIYILLQTIIAWFFAPLPPARQRNHTKPLKRVAVIGTGITGISTAAHLLGHGFEVDVYEQGDESSVGGIWSRVNSTSGLQIASLMYRWFPAVVYSQGYPKRDEILDNAKTIWERYGLKERTKFNTKVEKVTRHSSSTDPAEKGQSRWVINGNEDVVYDGIVATVGTCGKPKRMDLPGQDAFKGKIVHSSELDDVELSGKKVLIVGGGASGVEALELAVQKKAKSSIILARSDKWVIPRLTAVDVLLSLQPFGRETFLSWIPELLLRKLHYRDLEEKMAPTQGFYTGTPIVNSSVLQHIRAGKADYLRGDLKKVTDSGVSFNFRKRGQAKGDKGKHTHLDADVIVVATGYEKPSLDFLPDDLFPEDYQRPNMYLQVSSCSRRDCETLLPLALAAAHNTPHRTSLRWTLPSSAPMRRSRTPSGPWATGTLASTAASSWSSSWTPTAAPSRATCASGSTSCAGSRTRRPSAASTSSPTPSWSSGRSRSSSCASSACATPSSSSSASASGPRRRAAAAARARRRRSRASSSSRTTSTSA